MKSLVLGLTLLFSVSGSAEELLCDLVSSRGEGHWPISEASFTKERADEALEKLADWIQQYPAGMDFVSVETEVVYIRGYLLKVSIVPEDPNSVRDFCQFIEEEAYVRH